MSEAVVAGPEPTRSEDDASFGVRMSFALHSALIVAVLLKSLIFTGKPVAYVPTLRVDLVGLPDVLKKDLVNAPPSKEIADALKKADQELKKVKALPKIKETAPKADPDEMVVKPKQASEESEAQREKRMKAALKRIEALNKISDDSGPKAPALIKGNKISKGTSLSGEARESAQASYFDSIRDKLQENWALPVWVARQDLSAQVQIFIDAHGRLANFKFVKTSGNSQFDNAVKRALQESAPFSSPPDAISPALLSDGVLIGFPL